MGKGHVIMRYTKALYKMASPTAFFSRVKEKIDQIFTEQEIELLARTNKFVQRKSKLKGFTFLLFSLFDYHNHKEKSLNKMCVNLMDYGIRLRKQSLDARFNPAAVNFLRSVTQKMLSLKLSSAASSIKGLDFFNRVLILDSTSFQLPETFADTYKGSGGDGSPAGIKIQFCYNLKANGNLDFEIQNAATSDKTNELMYKDINAGDLRIEDLGYFKYSRLQLIANKGAYYLSRMPSNAVVYLEYEGNLSELDLPSIIKKMYVGQISEFEIVIGLGQYLKTRLILEKLPEEVTAQKVRKYKRAARRKGRVPVTSRLIFCSVNAYITNVPVNVLPKENVRKLYSLRWQIEVIFKTWKSYYHINQIKDVKIARFECYLYGRLILILLHLKIYQALKKWIWNNMALELSELKSFQVLVSQTSRLKQMLFEEVPQSTKYLASLFDILSNTCIKERKKSKEKPMDIIYRLSIS